MFGRARFFLPNVLFDSRQPPNANDAAVAEAAFKKSRRFIQNAFLYQYSINFLKNHSFYINLVMVSWQYFLLDVMKLLIREIES